MYSNKVFVHQVGKKDYHFIRIHDQQNIKKKWKLYLPHAESTGISKY